MNILRRLGNFWSNNWGWFFVLGIVCLFISAIVFAVVDAKNTNERIHDEQRQCEQQNGILLEKHEKDLHHHVCISKDAEVVNIADYRKRWESRR